MFDFVYWETQYDKQVSSNRKPCRCWELEDRPGVTKEKNEKQKGSTEEDIAAQALFIYLFFFFT